jgi:arginyl-tRNA synthetase
MNIKQEIIKLINSSLLETFPTLSTSGLPEIEIELPKDRNHGDFSSNIAMKLSGVLKKAPPVIAKDLQDSLNKNISLDLKQIKVEPPGYINFFVNDETYYNFLKCFLTKPDKSFASDLGKNEKVQIEFVSANPTGPLSVAHGRQAAVGEALGRIFSLFNFKVTKEYYLNDEGNQINLLGASVIARLLEIQNKPCKFPENGYLGDYIKEIAQSFLKDKSSVLSEISQDLQSDNKIIEQARDYAVKYILDIIKKELDDFGVEFDVWYSQKTLRESGKIEKALDLLKNKGHIYEKDGAVWFKSTDFGDDKDRVLIKSDGSFTYLAPDIAYHQDKFKRGFSRVINIWGPDHHGYIPRLTAAVVASGIERNRLSVVIVQLARIFRNGAPLVMSTRKAQYITLREVMDEVGSDAAKFFFLTRRTDSHLDFDLEVAKKQSSENPVYYVQYTYARICGVMKQAKDKKLDSINLSKIDFSLLKEEEEKILLHLIFRFPSCLENCLNIIDPYPISQYLMELATEFHRYYDRHKILVDNNLDLAQSRLILARSVGVIISFGLELLAINCPERM